MKLDVLFNWPPGVNSARIDLGSPNVEDVKKEFRVGVMPKARPGMIGWHDAGWVAGGEVHEQFQGRISRGDKIVVEQRLIGEEDADARLVIDTEKDWPAGAEGGTQVNQGWTF